MTKQYKIISIKIRPQQDEFENVISHVAYQVTATEDGIEAVYRGECGLKLPENSIIPFNELTEEQVIQWVQSVIDVEKMDQLLSKLIIHNRYGAPVEVESPWNS